ncbi:MAG TPA: hypothetical protein VFX28_08830, partial [Methylomirabilota bacterium]|nr:hypothetical protein [Methylomirabilota bacterium]
MSNPEPTAPPPGAGGRLLAAGSGLLLAAAYPHADIGALAFLALVPLLVALRGCTVREAALRGFLCGVVFFSTLLYWIVTVTVTYGHLAWPVGGACLLLLVAYLAGSLALFAGGVAGLWRRAGPM